MARLAQIARWLRVTYLWLVIPPLLSLFLGAASNQAVIAANGDTFPVVVNAAKSHAAPGEMLDDVHIVAHRNSRLVFLADWIDVGAILSPGDVLIVAGEKTLAFCLIVWGVLAVRRMTRDEAFISGLLEDDPDQ